MEILERIYIQFWCDLTQLASRKRGCPGILVTKFASMQQLYMQFLISAFMSAYTSRSIIGLANAICGGNSEDLPGGRSRKGLIVLVLDLDSSFDLIGWSSSVLALLPTRRTLRSGHPNMQSRTWVKSTSFIVAVMGIPYMCILQADRIPDVDCSSLLYALS